MGSITENRLGGISLIVGIPGATILWILFTLVLGSDTEPNNFAGQAADNLSASTIQNVVWLLPPALLIMAWFGFSVIYQNLKESGIGAPLFRLGLTMFGINVIGVAIAFGLSQASVWHGEEGSTYVAAAAGIGSYGGIIGGVGAILSALALASRDDYNKIFAYVVAAVFSINLIFSIVGWTDISTWKLGNNIAGLCFIVIAAWSITLGLGLLKKE